MHFKRKSVPTFWPIPRKGTKYTAVPSHNQYNSIPLIVALRDVFKIVGTTKELKMLLKEKKVLVNQKPVKETNYSISLFDVISLPDMKKNYIAGLSENKKMIFEEVSDKESHIKVYKVISRKMIGNKKIQVNLMQGRNLLINDKVNNGDSIMIDLKSKKIVKIIPLQKGTEVFVMEGKHTGKRGKVNEIIDRGGKKIAKITTEKEKLNVWVKNLIGVN